MKVKLTESKLKQIVAESVKKVLNEDYGCSKKDLMRDLDTIMQAYSRVEADAKQPQQKNEGYNPQEMLKHLNVINSFLNLIERGQGKLPSNRDLVLKLSSSINRLSILFKYYPVVSNKMYIETCTNANNCLLRIYNGN